MTMQVAMIGTDGIVLAGDTKWALTQNTMHLVSRHTSSASKIRASANGALAVAFARNMETSGAIADAIIAELSNEDFDEINSSYKVQKIAQKVFDDAGDRNDVQCLIVSTRPRLRLFQIEKAMLNGVPNTMMCHHVRDKAVNGDNANAAVFWVERYYRMAPVQYLALLAAKLIVDAARLNSGFIGGLEMVVCGERGVRRVSDDSIADLLANVEEWDRGIEEFFTRSAVSISYE